jgi:uncharacterized protein YndB with AHSA1/START domain
VGRGARLGDAGRAWEPEPRGPDMGPPSRVTVDFVPDGPGTRVAITHSELAGDESPTQHEHGWNAVLDDLQARVLGS